MPEPQWHAAAAPAVYLAARRIQSAVDPATVAAVSVLIDADHCCDILYYRVTDDRFRQLVPLHSWELVTLLLLCPSRRVRSIGAGFLVHHLFDLVFGDYSVNELSLAYRGSKRFRTGWMGDWAQWPNSQRGWRQVFYSETQDRDEPEARP